MVRRGLLDVLSGDMEVSVGYCMVGGVQVGDSAFIGATLDEKGASRNEQN